MHITVSHETIGVDMCGGYNMKERKAIGRLRDEMTKLGCRSAAVLSDEDIVAWIRVTDHVGYVSSLTNTGFVNNLDNLASALMEPTGKK